MSAAKVTSSGAVAVLDQRAEPDGVTTEADVKDPTKLARLLTATRATLALLRRRWAPRRIDFEDVTVGTSGLAVRLEHGFGGRVRWWVVGLVSTSGTDAALKEDTTNTTKDTLVLFSYVAATVVIRVEEAG